jgi:hypothetical protein
LCGREFRLITYRHNWGENRVYFENDDGKLASLPAAWTDILPPDPVIVIEEGTALFRLQDHLELTRLLAQLRTGGAP